MRAVGGKRMMPRPRRAERCGETVTEEPDVNGGAPGSTKGTRSRMRRFDLDDRIHAQRFFGSLRRVRARGPEEHAAMKLAKRMPARAPMRRYQAQQVGPTIS